MRQYNDSYQRTRDIDWFFSCKGKFFHVASNGGKLPAIVKVNENQKIQHYFALQEPNNRGMLVVANEKNYDLSSFMEYARKGFISIDRDEGDFDTQKYHVVARPIEDKGPSLDKETRLLIHEFDYEQEHFIIEGLL